MIIPSYYPNMVFIIIASSIIELNYKITNFHKSFITKNIILIFIYIHSTVKTNNIYCSAHMNQYTYILQFRFAYNVILKLISYTTNKSFNIFYLLYLSILISVFTLFIILEQHLLKYENISQKLAITIIIDSEIQQEFSIDTGNDNNNHNNNDNDNDINYIYDDAQQF